MITFGELRASRISDTIGVCSDKPVFLAMTNESVSRLLNRGGWWNNVRKLSVCARCSSITWPREVESVLAVGICGRSKMVQGYWTEWLPMDGVDYCGRFRGDVIIESAGTVPVQAPLRCGAARYIRAFPAYKADEGKQITIYGTDNNGQTIFSKRDDGTYLPGVVLTLAIPFVGTPFLVREVDRVLKDATMGPVRLYAYDAVSDTMEDMAFYQPAERSPSFLHSTIRACRRGTCNGLTAVTALVRLRFIPVQADDDLVQIDNLSALKFAMLSIRSEDAGETDEALRLWAKSIHEMNVAQRSKLPDGQIPISIEIFGTASPAVLGVGRCV